MKLIANWIKTSYSYRMTVFVRVKTSFSGTFFLQYNYCCKEQTNCWCSLMIYTDQDSWDITLLASRHSCFRSSLNLFRYIIIIISSPFLLKHGSQGCSKSIREKRKGSVKHKSKPPLPPTLSRNKTTKTWSQLSFSSQEYLQFLDLVVWFSEDRLIREIKKEKRNHG